MLFFLIIGLLIGAAAVVFILQNVTTVSVVFFAWQLNGSLALVLLLAIIAGILITMLFLLPTIVANRFLVGSLRKQNKKLQADLNDAHAVLRTPTSQTYAPVSSTVETTTVKTETTGL